MKQLYRFLLFLFSGAILFAASGFAMTDHLSAQTDSSEPTFSSLQQLSPANLRYQGAFAYPVGDPWAYSGHAMAYYPGGDPNGPADGYPGSLYAAGLNPERLVGEISIPAPVITKDFAALPRARVLRPLADITGGWRDNCTYEPGCEYIEVAGLAYLDNVDKIAWNLRDWYNVAARDQDSLGWSNRNFSGARGVWHIGPRNNIVFDNAKTTNYLFKAPVAFANQHLGGKWLLAGNARPAGAFGGSQGPSIFATAPWQDGNPPASGRNLAALALLYYPEVGGCIPNPALCHFPNYRAADDWGGGVWLEGGGKSAVVMMGRKGLGANCYGTPGDECPVSPCTPDKGWQASPYEAQMLFYNPADLVAVVAGTKQPWQLLPYAIHRPGGQLLQPNCGNLTDATYDAARQLIYVAQGNAGPFGETVVHVWAVETNPATITIVHDAVPDSATNFRFSGGLGSFYLDDITPQDADEYSNRNSFTVAPGTYNITESVPSTWVLAGITCDPSANGIVNLAQKRVTITVATGSNVTCTFTNHYRATFNTLVYHDLNQNRVYNSGEPGLPGWTVSIYDSNNLQLFPKTTGTSGAANFTRQLAPNVTYKVCVDIATGWTQSVPTVLDPVLGKPCYTRTPTPGQTLTLRFGNKPLAVGAAAEEEVTEAVEDVTLEEAPELAPDESGYDAGCVEEEETAPTATCALFLPLIHNTP